MAPERLPDFNDPAELERAVVSFGECVEQSFPIVIRFRAEAFNGMSTEVSSQTEEAGERVKLQAQGTWVDDLLVIIGEPHERFRRLEVGTLNEIGFRGVGRLPGDCGL
jgi:hypothetical protein